jgi:hypothetical protein
LYILLRMAGLMGSTNCGVPFSLLLIPCRVASKPKLSEGKS